MTKQKETGILDFLPAEATKAIDELGYKFLAEQGYSVEGAIESRPKRMAIRREMKKRKEELYVRSAINKSNGAVLVWYELFREGQRVTSSRGLKILPKGVINEVGS